jgi:hypothetical protein
MDPGRDQRDTKIRHKNNAIGWPNRIFQKLEEISAIQMQLQKIKVESMKYLELKIRNW